MLILKAYLVLAVIVPLVMVATSDAGRVSRDG